MSTKTFAEYNAFNMDPLGTEDSFTQITGDIHWLLSPKFTRYEENDYLTIVIECQYNHRSSNLWSIDAEFEVEILDTFVKRIIVKKDCSFNKWELSSSLDFGKIPKMNTYFRDCCYGINLHSTIRLKESSFGIQKSPINWFSIPQNLDSEVVIVFNGTEFYVDKYILMACSSAFREMLSLSDRLIVKDREIEVNDFRSFLGLLYQHHRAAIRWAKSTLILAFRFDVPFLIEEYEDMLISLDLDINHKVYYALRFQLPKLQEFVDFTTAEKNRKITENCYNNMCWLISLFEKRDIKNAFINEK